VEEDNNTFLKEGTVLEPKAVQEAIHLLKIDQAEADLERAVRVRDIMERKLVHAVGLVIKEAYRLKESLNDVVERHTVGEGDFR